MGTDLSKGLTVIISSPGGSALAAERLINVCRQHSNDNFEVIVPKQAKSAATLLCFGSNKITMSRTSELGPVDPQVFQRTPDGNFYVPADIIIKRYRQLMQDAIACTGRIEPYLQQLTAYDSRMIAQFEREQQLCEDISVTALQKSMMKGKSRAAILQKIKPFLEPEQTSSHGRPIFMDRAKKSSLNIDEIDINSELWGLVMELHVRADNLVSRDACKLVESVEHQFMAPAPD